MKRMVQSKRLTALGIAGLILGASIAHADLVTDAGVFSSPTVIDFSEFNGDFLFTAGPVQIGTPATLDIEWFSTSTSSVIGNGGYGLSENGSWTAARIGYTGLNEGIGAMTFELNDGPVDAIGGFINYAILQGVPDGDAPLIEVLDQSGSVLESYDLTIDAPISTPNGMNEGAFRGIVRPQADIYALRVQNAFVVLDDLTFSGTSAPSAGPPVAIPTMSNWALILLASLMAMFAFAWRRALS